MSSLSFDFLLNFFSRQNLIYTLIKKNNYTKFSATFYFFFLTLFLFINN